MRAVASAYAEDFDRYYRDHTRVHSLLATDDEIRLPDGSYVDDDAETITLSEYRRGS